MRVAIIGAGIIGLSAARSIAARGHSVDLFEQYAFGHDRGSSHGRSRIVRRAYPDAYYAERMAEAYPLWRELEQATATEIFNESGLVYCGSRDSNEIQCVARALRHLEVKHDVVDRHTVAKVFPMLRLADDEIGVFTPEAGHLRADRAMAATKDLAEHHGARLHFGATSERSVLERDYDVWIAAAGPWIRQWVPIPVTQTVQTYAYLDAHVEGPVWIHHDGDYVYGFPTDELGLRAAPHRLGPEIDDLDGVRAVSDEAVTAVQRTVHKIFGIDARVVSTHTCLYTNYANEDFQLGRIGGNGFYASVCSGHGFKFGPYIGKLMADFVEGKDEPERHARWATNYPDA